MRMYSKVKNYSLFHSLFPKKIYFSDQYIEKREKIWYDTKCNFIPKEHSLC